ncbi:MAG: serine/threonine-protein kinase, partial [Planctomycetes bacterium]|nr:serine/threonine-protein kinase [Planctomycetota bacterium]
MILCSERTAMTEPEDSSPPESLVDKALAEFKAAWFSQDPPDPETFCRAYPDFASELRKKIDDFLYVVGFFSGQGSAPDCEPIESVEEKAAPQRILGDFKIVRELGKGGMGVVYEAEQISLKRRVALKLLPPPLGLSDHAVRKFKREAEAGGRQSHPGIVAIYAMGETDGVYYIAQELVPDGKNLADQLEFLRGKDVLPIGYFKETAEFIAEVADALSHAHAQRIIHRDVKPSNILITPEGNPKLTDFGLAKIENALDLSRSGDFMGTPYYMSPEQAASRRMGIDLRTDVFSLGVTLYELLTLERPFEGDTSHEIVKKILLHEPRDPQRVNPRVPRDLAVICLKALEKDPSRRYQSMDAFSDDLGRFISGEVIQAKPSGLLDKAWKRIKRNPAVSAAVSVTLIALIVLSANMIRSAHEDKINRRAADYANKTISIFKGILSANRVLLNRRAEVVGQLSDVEAWLKTEIKEPTLPVASLRGVLGKIYFDLGQYKKAEPHLQSALELHERFNGKEALNTLQARADLARLRSAQGKFNEAETAYEAILEACNTYLGNGMKVDNSIDEVKRLALICRERSAGVSNRLGRHDEAETLYEQVVADQSALLGEEDPDTLVSMSGLANTLNIKGEYSRSEEIYRKV